MIKYNTNQSRESVRESTGIVWVNFLIAPHRGDHPVALGHEFCESEYQNC